MTLRHTIRRLADRLTVPEGRQDPAAVCERVYFGAAARMLADVADRDGSEELVPGWTGLPVHDFRTFLQAEIAARPGPVDDSKPAVGWHVEAWTRLDTQTRFRADLEAAVPGPVPRSWWWWVVTGYSAHRPSEYQTHARGMAYRDRT